MHGHARRVRSLQPVSMDGWDVQLMEASAERKKRKGNYGGGVVHTMLGPRWSLKRHMQAQG